MREVTEAEAAEMRGLLVATLIGSARLAGARDPLGFLLEHRETLFASVLAAVREEHQQASLTRHVMTVQFDGAYEVAVSALGGRR